MIILLVTVLPLAFYFFAFVAHCWLCARVGQDAFSRGMPGWAWCLATFATGPYALFVYWLVRNKHPDELR